VTSLTLDRFEFLSLVETGRPLSDIRRLLLSWAEAGASREQIRSALNEVRSELQTAGREAEEDRVLEALDLVEGWVSPHLKLTFSEPNAPASLSPRLSFATVLMPPEGEFTQIATDLVLPALTQAALQTLTPSQHADEANAVFTLIDNIRRSSVVVVDTSGLDAFVLYALGVAHALETPTIVLTRDITELPFDLRSYNVLPYSTRLDEIGQLKDGLRRMLIDLKEVESAVATPVSDIGGSRRQVTTDVQEEIGADEEPPGIYDLLPSAIEAMEAIGAATIEFGTLTEELGRATQAQTTEIEEAKARGGPGVFGRTRLSIRTVTAHVDEYADEVANMLPQYQEQWSAFVNDTLTWIDLVDIAEDEDREAAMSFASKLDELREAILGALQHVEDFRGAVVGLRARRLSKDLGASLSRVDKQLKEWIDQVLTGASQLERMRAVLTERVYGQRSLS